MDFSGLINRFSANLSFLVLTRGVQAIVPILIYPLLIDRLGLDKLGFALYWLSLCAFLASVASLNLETYSSRLVRLADDSQSLAASLLAPVKIKIYSGGAVLLLWLLLASYFAENAMELGVILLSIHPLITSVFFPTHYLIGRGHFRLMFFLTVVEKIVLIFLIFTLISDAEDLLYLPLSHFVSLVGVNVVVWFVLNSRLELGIQSWNLADTSGHLEVAPSLAIGKVLQVHTTGARFIVGSLFGPASVVLYDVGEKVINMAKVPLTVIGQVAFSYLKGGKNKYVALLAWLLLVGAVELIVIFQFDDHVLGYFLGNDIPEDAFLALHILGLILLFLPFLIALGSNYLVKNGHPSQYGKLLLFSNLTTIIILAVAWLSGVLSFSLFLGWVVLCEALLSMLCLVGFLRN